MKYDDSSQESLIAKCGLSQLGITWAGRGLNCALLEQEGVSIVPN